MESKVQFWLSLGCGLAFSLAAGCGTGDRNDEGGAATGESSALASADGASGYGDPFPEPPRSFDFQSFFARGSFSFTDIPGLNLGETQSYTLEGHAGRIQVTYTNPMMTETYFLALPEGSMTVLQWDEPQVFVSPQKGGAPLAYASALNKVVEGFSMFSATDWYVEVNGRAVETADARAEAVAPYASYLGEVARSFTDLFVGGYGVKHSFLLNTDCAAVGAAHKNIEVTTSAENGLRIDYEDYGWFELKVVSETEEQASCTKWWVVERDWTCPSETPEILRQARGLVERVKNGNECSPAHPELEEVLFLIDWHLARLGAA